MADLYSIDSMKNWSKEEIFDFIRRELKWKDVDINSLKHIDRESFKKEHRRFDMSGYETETGECTIHNLSILNTFAYLGIYDYTYYLFLDFYKGNPTLYLKYWNDDENLEFDFACYGTVEIIYEIFKLTILNDENLLTRRRL